MTLPKREPSPELKKIGHTFQYLNMLLRKESNVHWLRDENQLQRKYPLTELYNSLQQEVQKCTGLRELFRVFREFKQKHFLRIGGRDCLGLAGLEETMSQLSDLAGVCLQAGLSVLGARMDWWMSEGRGFDPKSNPVAVLGLGKLGGAELNYVSDIDLVFLGGGQKNKKNRGSGRQKFMQTLTALISDQVDGDRVFKVDLRLRPQGKDGDLVPSLEAAVDHYLVRGRAWERQALLKARTIAGSRELGGTFLQEVRPFVFRRFLDFQSLDELKTMRDRILEQARQQSSLQSFDVKLGQGGIREVEFIVQSFQLIYGGRYRELDEPNTLRCLDRLAGAGLLEETVKTELREGYCFLRRMEHWIQLDTNRQQHKLPTSSRDLERLAGFMGFGPDKEAMDRSLREHCRRITGHFESLFAGKKPVGQAGTASGETVDKKTVAGSEVDKRPGHLDPELLRDFSREVADVFVKELDLLSAKGKTGLFEKGRTRTVNVLNRIRIKPGLIRLLNSSPAWLPRVGKGVVRSPLIADLLANQPGLMEGLPAQDFELEFALWKERADSILAGCTDYEQAVEWIRRLKNERMLTLALAESSGDLKPQQAEFELSSLADYVLEETCRIVSLEVLGTREVPLTVLALGKLGSFELGYLSDLDLMYVYEAGPGQDQEKIPAKVIKFIQRFMRMLSTPLQEGPGYDVDSRLRPTGNYGPLVVTRRRWELYYANEADIWEVQSLLRLRSVAGNKSLGRELVRFARDICSRPRRPEEVWGRLCHLRQRMEAERGKEAGSRVDLKLGFGGMADFEFLIQGHQLISNRPVHDCQPLPTAEFLDIPLRELKVGPERLARLKKIFTVYQAIDHLCQIFARQTGAGLGPETFREVIALGPGIPEVTWEELLGMRKEVRKVWSGICEGSEIDL
ncbi:MAG: bifunctional [glutamate--ammonia ligase]-adenylyl-L-tyrosine phosphorylase/[glutamate--ammonia-ligase] adenylyltransferase [Desulfohalobiaceae bacterium]|nr:bifunctional [glutamate--ammonia ligase]-adenylyl-L-tyrosine phosphorylase/[glutamate--ammonia-ligase] adenylyltransferase [Desulfohalobiaceae bacterium]